MAEAIDTVVRQRVKEYVQAKQFLAVSLDSSTDSAHHSRMILQVYMIDNLERKNVFVGFPMIHGDTNAETLTNVDLSTLSDRLDLAITLSYRVPELFSGLRVRPR